MLTYHSQDDCCKVKGACEFPLWACFVRFVFDYHNLYHLVVLLRDVVLPQQIFSYL